MLNLNIRNKFLVPTIVLIVLGMGVSASISYIKAKNALSASLMDNIEQRASSTATSLESWIRDRQLDLKSWSHEGIYAKATKASIIGKAARVSANEKLSRLRSEYGYYEDLFLTDAQGEIIASNNTATIGNLIKRELEVRIALLPDRGVGYEETTSSASLVVSISS